MPEGNDDPKGSDKTLTQEQVDKIVEERLARERKKFEDYDDLKAQVEELKSAAAEKSKEADKTKSESEKLNEQLQQLQQGLDEEKTAREKAELKALRSEVASDKKIPKAFIDRLTGSTREELEEDADSILEAIGGKDEEEEETEDTSPFGRPKEKLTPGASNDDKDAGVDFGKVADKVLSDNIL